MVYVDDMRAPFGRMLMCHMIADTSEELVAMAEAIGVSRKWIQYAGTPKEHFDIALTKREKALLLGARQITMRQLSYMHRWRRLTGHLCKPEEAELWVHAFGKRGLPRPS